MATVATSSPSSSTSPFKATMNNSANSVTSFCATLGSGSGDKYRGAVVEDLQLPPAFALPENEAIARAIELAYDRDFSHIPVLNPKGRRPLGYIDVATLKSKWEKGEVNPDDPVSKAMSRFQRSVSNKYTLITPETPLGELERFLKENIFALVTDCHRRFVLALATQQDLDNFVQRRGL